MAARAARRRLSGCSTQHAACSTPPRGVGWRTARRGAAPRTRPPHPPLQACAGAERGRGWRRAPSRPSIRPSVRRRAPGAARCKGEVEGRKARARTSAAPRPAAAPRAAPPPLMSMSMSMPPPLLLPLPLPRAGGCRMPSPPAAPSAPAGSAIPHAGGASAGDATDTQTHTHTGRRARARPLPGWLRRGGRACPRLAARRAPRFAVTRPKRTYVRPRSPGAAAAAPSSPLPPSSLAGMGWVVAQRAPRGEARAAAAAVGVSGGGKSACVQGHCSCIGDRAKQSNERPKVSAEGCPAEHKVRALPYS